MATARWLILICFVFQVISCLYISFFIIFYKLSCICILYTSNIYSCSC
jgi:hypothetical protein